jgi:hypothetical protein
MTAPEDDLEQALRRALAAAVSRVEPGADGLERIRARIKRHPPQPWLTAVLCGFFTRARYWVWRGHWAWPDRLPLPRLRRLPQAADRTPAGRRGTGTARPASHRRPSAVSTGTNWLRPAALLAGIAFILGIALGVPTFRQAIVQASSNVLTGGQSSGGSGAHGGGAPAARLKADRAAP